MKSSPSFCSIAHFVTRLRKVHVFFELRAYTGTFAWTTTHANATNKWQVQIQEIYEWLQLWRRFYASSATVLDPENFKCSLFQLTVQFPENITGRVLSESPASFGADASRDEEQLHSCSDTRGCRYPEHQTTQSYPRRPFNYPDHTATCTRTRVAWICKR